MAESKLRTLSVDFAVQILDLENLPSKIINSYRGNGGR